MISEGTLCKNWHSGRMRGRWCYRSIDEHWKVVIYGTSMAKECLLPLFPLYVVSPNAIPNREASMLQIFPNSYFSYTPEKEVSLYAVFQVFGNDINSLPRTFVHALVDHSLVSCSCWGLKYQCYLQLKSFVTVYFLSLATKLIHHLCEQNPQFVTPRTILKGSYQSKHLSYSKTWRLVLQLPLIACPPKRTRRSTTGPGKPLLLSNHSPQKFKHPSLPTYDL